MNRDFVGTKVGLSSVIESSTFSGPDGVENGGREAFRFSLSY